MPKALLLVVAMRDWPFNIEDLWYQRSVCHHSVTALLASFNTEVCQYVGKEEECIVVGHAFDSEYSIQVCS